MNKAVNGIRLFLFTCSGEDNYILKKCSSKIQRRFALIGFFVLLIFLGCFFSASFFAYSLFEGAKWASLPMGIIWGAVVVNMYLLLLHTISPAIIPLSTKNNSKNGFQKNEKTESILSFSMFLRLGFMVLLAIIIAQPLNVVMISSSVKSSIEKHKIAERVNLYTLTNKELIKNELHNQKEFNQKIVDRLNEDFASTTKAQIAIINSKIERDNEFILITSKKLNYLNKIDEDLFLTDKAKLVKKELLIQLDNILSEELASDADFITTVRSTSIDGSLKEDYITYKNNLINLVTEKTNNYNALNHLLNKSNFYIKTIQLLLAENPVSWFVTLLVCLLFLLPIYFKYKVRNLSAVIFKIQEQNEPEIIRLREELINTTNFNWLEKKIKSTNIKNIRTSDYYFLRMLIEHKIIFEEYEETKSKFSNILTDKIRKCTQNSNSRLQPLLEKLKQVNLAKYNEISKQIFEEYVEEEMIKYEYWLDCPFRTKKILIPSIINNEIGLLDFVYNYTEEAEKQ